MKKKILLSIAIIVGMWISGQAQERYIFSQHFVNPVLINPGATGFGDAHNFLFNYRNKWASFPGAPNTYAFSYDGIVADKVGLGGFVMKDEFGALESLKGQLSYAYHLMGENYKVGLGFTTEYIQYRAKGALSGPVGFDRNDPLIADRQEGDRFFDLALGAHGMISERILFDVVFPGLVRTKLSDGAQSLKEEKSFNYILGVGYQYKVENYDLTVTPSIFVKQLRNVPLHIEGNLLLSFYDGQLSGGLSYAYGAEDRFGALLGTGINNFNFYYSYNVSFQPFQTYSNGSHELTIGYRIPVKSK
jgi:type IX secretion system PorP/SprF family membrane protein